jgi:glycosyltransferase involved in cell wall biosynthesis
VNDGERRTRVSVCLAAFRGEQFIRQQMDSILEQLGPEDELVVVDDASPDRTWEVVADVRDARIRLHRNDVNIGYVRTFERAVRYARGDLLFFADQDDVWLPGRLEAMVAALESSAVVSTSVSVLGEPVEPPRFRLRARDSRRHLANIVAILVGYRPYTGCAMAFRRDILDSVLPIPSFVYESHDLWLALVANTHGENLHLERASVARRLHAGNQTPIGWRGPRAILRARWMKARCLVVALARARAYRRARATRQFPGRSALGSTRS